MFDSPEVSETSLSPKNSVVNISKKQDRGYY